MTDLPMWHPPSGRGPGLVLIQEIFGLDDYLRSVAADLAAAGYVVAIPELFRRTAPGWSSTHDEAGVAASMEVAASFDPELGLADVLETMAHLRSLPEVESGVGLLGFCLGGSLAFAAAAEGDPDTAVSFYGSTVAASIAELSRVTCPIQFHFGGQDPYIPRSDVALVEAAVAAHPGAEIHVQEEAGHAFHNHVAPMFHHPEAAARAWTLTTEFLRRTLPGSR
ncbi:dienelactone hydrolase family protein [Amycolatopsis sp. SID8362]|uniref:dienelactone hydrolase family protein n=1 Tax=Amycolatopsis sp. SID8362 TaxID=2690346 RepID=UPI001367D7BF|nr:dienelactone hydrolase family protein [Amycolatopsis sp. SID8362]NBH05238.1 dienelactone hydrolase family protein [Amycolatopsis sp. SID8362]NED41938.1 dienelactone hydrolase family protein [Amycolatopsis sp. SID8362]